VKVPDLRVGVFSFSQIAPGNKGINSRYLNLAQELFFDQLGVERIF
jgi:hypothetical protein